MQWVIDNWIWIALGVGMIAMHMFGHGGHGGHRKSRKEASTDAASEPEAPSIATAEGRAGVTGDPGIAEKHP